MANAVFMDVARVNEFSNRFQTFGETLKTVASGLEAAINVLDATAFIGLVGGTALARYLETFQPVIEQLSEKCLEISTDLVQSATAFENGDAEGSTRFF